MAAIVGSADAPREAMRSSVEPVERADHARALADAREHLDPSDFARAWEHGRAMALDDWTKVVAFALGEWGLRLCCDTSTPLKSLASEAVSSCLKPAVSFHGIPIVVKSVGHFRMSLFMRTSQSPAYCCSRSASISPRGTSETSSTGEFSPNEDGANSPYFI